MDREELTKLPLSGPIRITMNDGSVFDIPSKEFATVSDISASVLYKAADGKWRHYRLPLVAACPWSRWRASRSCSRKVRIGASEWRNDRE